jgi:hypothetical protein
MPQQLTLSATIRQALIDTGANTSEISRQTGVTQPQVWQFVKAGADCKASTLDKFAAWLGLALTPTASSPNKSSRKRGATRRGSDSPPRRNKGATHEKPKR